MTIQRLVPLTLGWQELDRCIALDGYPRPDPVAPP